VAIKTVLIVDDNAVVRAPLRRLLESHPEFEVSGEAENGQDAIDKAELLKPDLIILDLAMPIMNGFEAAAILRKMLPQVRLILFTAHDGNQVHRLAQAAGINAVVAKGKSSSALIAQAKALVA
jgi:DNA-binding NarL/FixJ family response regulator